MNEGVDEPSMARQRQISRRQHIDDSFRRRSPRSQMANRAPAPQLSTKPWSTDSAIRHHHGAAIDTPAVGNRHIATADS